MDAHAREILKAMNCCRVGTIKSFDPGVKGIRAPTATVSIAQLQVTSIQITAQSTSQQTLSPFPDIEMVPVVFMKGGRYRMNFYPQPGDECLLLFSDRAIDNWLEQGSGQPPNMGRLHDLADAIALVGIDSNPNASFPPVDGALQIVSEDYTGLNGVGELIAMSPGNITINADTIIIHGRVKTSVDAHGTGYVITPGNINTWTDTAGGGVSQPPGPL